jgi:quinol monooxygenase YgiN
VRAERRAPTTARALGDLPRNDDLVWSLAVPSPSLTTTAVPANAAMHMLGSVVTMLTIPEDKEPAFLAWAKARLAEINAHEQGAVVAVLAAAKTPQTYVWVERGDRTRTQHDVAMLQDWASAPPQVMQLTDAVPAMDRHALGDAKTITLVVTMPIKPKYEQTFLAKATEFMSLVRENEPGTLLYSVSKHPTGPYTFVWVERYRDEASVDAHGATPYFQALLPSLPEWTSGDVDVQTLTQVSPP